MNTIQSDLHIGVDVGKSQLDFYCHETGDFFTAANTPGGIRHRHPNHPAAPGAQGRQDHNDLHPCSRTRSPGRHFAPRQVSGEWSLDTQARERVGLCRATRSAEWSGG